MEQIFISSYGGERGMIETMRKLTDAIKRIPEFRIPDVVKVPWDQSADVFEEGREAEAIRMGLEAHTALRNIFGAYLRNAAVPKKEKEGDKGPTARFSAEIDRRDDLEHNYDEDIIAGLRKTFGVLEAAVRAETNGVFDQRIEAYLAMKKALSVADSQQNQLDNKMFANAPNFAIKDGVEPTRAQRRLAMILAARKQEEARRQAAEAAKVKRKVVANDARAMFA